MQILVKRNGNTWHFIEHDQSLFTGYQQFSFRIFSTRVYFKDLSNNRVIILRSSMARPFSSFFEWNGKRIRIATRKVVYKPYSQMQVDADDYELVSYKSRRYGIYKNALQIGLITQESLYLYDDETMELSVNDNENKLLICLFVFAVVCSFGENGRLNFNLGNAMAERYPFDPDWRAK